MAGSAESSAVAQFAVSAQWTFGCLRSSDFSPPQVWNSMAVDLSYCVGTGKHGIHGSHTVNYVHSVALKEYLYCSLSQEVYVLYFLMYIVNIQSHFEPYLHLGHTPFTLLQLL